MKIASLTWQRTRHPAGISTLTVTRILQVPAALADDRERRSRETVPLQLTVGARLAEGVPRVDLAVRVDNPARDHRLRLCFPTGRPAATYRAATTFDVAERSTAARADAGWMHRAPTTFAHQGWVSANGLTVLAPGLPEAEVTPAGTIAITLLRAVGWLARYDLRSRPGPAGPPIETPGAQLLGSYTAHLALLAGDDPAAARAAELGLRGAIGGAAPLLADGVSLLQLEPATLVLSALKPAERGDGVVVRVLNPTDVSVVAELRLGWPVAAARAVRLDEEPSDEPVGLAAGVARFRVPPRALRSVHLA